MTKAGEEAPTPLKRKAYDPAAVERFLSYVFDGSKGCVEVRVFKAEWKKGRIVRSEYHSTVCGWFDDPEKLVEAVQACKEVSLYVTVNPINPDLMARDNSNRLARTRTGSSDGDAVCLRWLYIDVDPVRKADISSTDGELALALEKRDLILALVPGLRGSSLWGCSGNGGWILARLADLDNTPENRDRVARTLASLSARFSDETVKVDPTTKNPSRVMCLPGTLKCKGTHTASRPWRPVTLDGCGADL